MTTEETLFLAQQNSPKTRETYGRGLRLLDVFVQKPYADVTDSDLIAWKGQLASCGYKPATQKVTWTSARSFFSWLVSSGRLSRSPFDAVKPPQRIKNLTPKVPTGDITVLLDATDETWRGKRDRAILHLLANGLRIGEIVELRQADLSYEPAYERILLKVLGKGQKQRIVPLGSHAVTAIQPWLEVAHVWSWLFPSDLNNTKMTTRQVREVVARAIKTSGMGGLSAHSLRHHYATRLARAGANVFTLRDLLGHEDIRTTQIYVGLDMADKVKAANLDPLK